MPIIKHISAKKKCGSAQPTCSKAANRPKKLIAASPREHVDPAARDKSVLGTCNR